MTVSQGLIGNSQIEMAQMDGIQPKLRRAGELIDELDQAVQAFTSGLSPLRIEGAYRAGSSTYGFRAFGSPVAPVRLAVLAGEVLYLQRSALDHAVTALVRDLGNHESRHNQFPICRTTEQYDACLRRGYLDGISDQQRHAIRALQPFNEANPDTSVLMALAELNNTDKHRLLLIAVAAARLGNEIRIGGPGDKTVMGMSPPYSHALSEDGVEFFSIDFGGVYEGLEATIDVRRIVAVQRPEALDWPFDYAPLTDLLRQIQQYIERSMKVS
jgi:hypothetical protein